MAKKPAKKKTTRTETRRPAVIYSWTVTRPSGQLETVMAHDLSTYDGGLTFTTRTDTDEYIVVRGISRDGWTDVALASELNLSLPTIDRDQPTT